MSDIRKAYIGHDVGATHNASFVFAARHYMRDAYDVTAQDILDQLDAKGVTRKQVAELLGISQPNATRLWLPDSRTGKRRELGYDEGQLLIEQFQLAPEQDQQLPHGRIPAVAANDDDVVDIISLDLSLSMGPGTLIEEFVEAEPVKMGLSLIQAITRTPTDRLRLVRGIGHSMEPTLRTDDRILIDINDRGLASLGGVYWIDYEGAHGIKRLRPAGKGRILIMSDNSSVEPPFEVSASDLRIEGRAIWFGRDL